jgi:dCMP deaminase
VSYVYCPAVHAEINAIVNSARQGVSIIGATMYLDVIGEARDGNGSGDQPCAMCRRAIINAGLKDIYYRGKDRKTHHINFERLIEVENEWMINVLNS